MMGNQKILEAAKKLWRELTGITKKTWLKWAATGMLGLVFYVAFTWLNSLLGYFGILSILTLLWFDELKKAAEWADQSNKILSFSGSPLCIFGTKLHSVAEIATISKITL